MGLRKNRLDIHVEKTENFINYLLKKRRENIQNSLIRPLYQEALKSFFLIIILLVDTLFPLEIFRLLSFPINIILSLIVIGILLYFEILFYNSLWGKKGRWSVDRYKKSTENTIEEKKE